MMPLALPSPAKINLILHIIGRRHDGYHLLQTVFTFLDLHDILHFQPNNTEVISLSGDLLGLCVEQNLIHKAATLLQPFAKTKVGVSIHITKRIPDGAGLGGGSSNAATTLIALNHIWKCNLNIEALKTLAVQLGADVPVFILGERCFAEGIGEKMTPISGSEDHYLLVFPQQKVPTAEIYSDPELTRDSPAIKIGNLLETSPRNDFEAVVRKRYPEVDKAFQGLTRFPQARLSGSGSAIFVPFSTREEAEFAATSLAMDLNPILCRGHNISAMRVAAQSAGIEFPEWGVAKR